MKLDVNLLKGVELSWSDYSSQLPEDSELAMEGKQFLLPAVQVGNIRVGWAYLGEGYDGGYNPDDPDNQQLLRIDLVTFGEVGDTCEEIFESTCTQVQTCTNPALLIAGALMALREVKEPWETGNSVRRLVEGFSWWNAGSLGQFLKTMQPT